MAFFPNESTLKLHLNLLDEYRLVEFKEDPLWRALETTKSYKIYKISTRITNGDLKRLFIHVH
jgi:hypothetical protein